MITITPYQSNWPTEFVRIGGGLREALGDLALRIDHIGSTAVPGLAAKDVIDVQVTARSLDPAIEEALRGIGYLRLAHITRDHVPPGHADDASQWTKWFYKGPAAERPVNLHVRLEGRPNQRYALLFRDYLRAHPPIAAAYAQIKLAMVTHGIADQDAYYDIKDPVCDIIIAGAEAWATGTGWTAGQSDCGLTP